mgnify:CR=1 FL=1
MDTMENIINDLGIASLENKIHLAAVALVSDAGKILYHTENFGLQGKTAFIFQVLQGQEQFSLNNMDFQ